MVARDDPSVTVLIVNSNVKHELTGSEYPQRRAACEEAARILGVAALRDATLEGLDAARERLSEEHYRRARHVISEINRTLHAAEALKGRDWQTVGRLMYASHASLRDDYEVSCEELDLLVEIARSIRRCGWRDRLPDDGGGFGGCGEPRRKPQGGGRPGGPLPAIRRDTTGIEAAALPRGHEGGMRTSRA